MLAFSRHCVEISILTVRRIFFCCFILFLLRIALMVRIAYHTAVCMGNHAYATVGVYLCVQTLFDRKHIILFYILRYYSKNHHNHIHIRGISITTSSASWR